MSNPPAALCHAPGELLSTIPIAVCLVFSPLLATPASTQADVFDLEPAQPPVFPLPLLIPTSACLGGRVMMTIG